MTGRGSSRSSKAAFALAVLLVGVVLSKVAAGRWSSATSSVVAASDPSVRVTVLTVTPGAIPFFYDYPGRTEAIRHISLQSKVTGNVTDQLVADGSDVAKGALLYRLDDRDFAARLEAARAQVARDEAALAYAQVRLQRAQKLVEVNAASRETLDERAREVKDAAGSLRADQAATRLAELSVSYTEIRAPFAGRLGRNMAPEGTLVKAGQEVLSTLTQLAPLYVSFAPSETDLREIRAAFANGSLRTQVEVQGEAQTYEGVLTFLDNAVDRSTGSIVARTTLPNKDRSLLPGQYVHVRLDVGHYPNAVYLPANVVGSDQQGRYVYLADANNKVERRPIELGLSDGDQVVVTKGLHAHDRVILGNMQRLTTGQSVIPAASTGRASHIATLG